MSTLPPPQEQIQQLTRHLLAQNQSCAAEAAESVLMRLADLQDALANGRPEAAARIAELYRRYYLEATTS